MFSWQRIAGILFHAAIIGGLVAGWLHRPAIGDTIWLSNGSQQHGRVLSRDGRQIRWLPWEGGKFGSPTELDQEQVEDLAINFDSNRLANLNSQSPAGYFDYAEELALQTGDPTALRLARRLYWLAVKHTRHHATYRSMLESSLRALAHLEQDPQRRTAIELYLAVQTGQPPQPNMGRQIELESTTTQQQQIMLDLVQAIRRRQSQAAIQILSNSDHDAVIEAWSTRCGRDDLDRMARKPLSIDDLRLLVSLELDLLKLETDSTGNSPRSNWLDQARRGTADALVPPNLESLTEFELNLDPFESGRFDY